MIEQDIIVLHHYLKDSRSEKSNRLTEAEELVKAINLNCIFSKSVGLISINPKTYLNSGFVKMLEDKAKNIKVKLHLKLK